LNNSDIFNNNNNNNNNNSEHLNNKLSYKKAKYKCSAVNHVKVLKQTGGLFLKSNVIKNIYLWILLHLGDKFLWQQKRRQEFAVKTYANRFGGSCRRGVASTGHMWNYSLTFKQKQSSRQPANGSL